ncbi:sterile alpha motif domain-containing protein 1-like [Lutra lutra]|uniref:sterile alpha motif domain-containing protein 1-like n=1 Tax=Lutra lutra TaxID=9657 RepID=UPI001FD0BD45|nr:sterile alpha motif domain-containing protein 1-like [Lutra lutra]
MGAGRLPRPSPRSPGTQHPPHPAPTPPSQPPGPRVRLLQPIRAKARPYLVPPTPPPNPSSPHPRPPPTGRSAAGGSQGQIAARAPPPRPPVLAGAPLAAPAGSRALCPLPHYCARLPPASPQPPVAPALSRSPLPPAPFLPPALGSLLAPPLLSPLYLLCQVPCGAERALPLAGRGPRRSPRAPSGLDSLSAGAGGVWRRGRFSDLTALQSVCKTLPPSRGDPASLRPAGSGDRRRVLVLRGNFPAERPAPCRSKPLSCHRTLSGRSRKELLLFRCSRRGKEAKVCASDS